MLLHRVDLSLGRMFGAKSSQGKSKERENGVARPLTFFPDWVVDDRPRPEPLP